MITYDQYLKIPIDTYTRAWLRDLLDSHYRFVSHNETGFMPRYLFDAGLLDSRPSAQYPGEYSIGLAGQLDMELTEEAGEWYLILALAPGSI